MRSLRKLLNNINIRGEILYDEPLSLHSTFRIGGNADIYVKVFNIDDIILTKKAADKENIPLYPIGGGANILFQDKGFRGIILDTSNLKAVSIDKERVSVKAGVEMSTLAEFTVNKNLKGLEAFYGMPGCAGGSIYMNARCYGISISDKIETVTYIDKNNSIIKYIYNENDLNYKISPFQNKNIIILNAVFKLDINNLHDIKKKMLSYKIEREEKGHYLYPCAGSVFKNNREFGEPTGKIIDKLGLRGVSIGGAMVSEKHANIIVNKGNATEKDVKNLIEYIKERIFDSFGIHLEREIIYVEQGR